MSTQPFVVLVLGASGMLGNSVYRLFSMSPGFLAFGTVRNSYSRTYFSEGLRENILVDIDVSNYDSLINVFNNIRPDLVVNCVGLVKQLQDSEDVLTAVPLNSLLPHRLAKLCQLSNSRLVQISTDCVFSGSKGRYTEFDFPDADDVYGRSKLLGEVDYPNAITLRTSIVGHELGSARSLLGWFLAQKGVVKGFKNAIFSGLPTVEVARVIRDHVIPNSQLRGVYHLSAAPISKFDFLALVADIYKFEIEILEDHNFVIDRSLDSSRFRKETGYQPSSWNELITTMRDFG